MAKSIRSKAKRKARAEFRATIGQVRSRVGEKVDVRLRVLLEHISHPVDYIDSSMSHNILCSDSKGCSSKEHGKDPRKAQGNH